MMRNADIVNGGKGMTQDYYGELYSMLKEKYKGEFDEDVFQESVVKLLTTDKYKYQSWGKERAFVTTVYRNRMLDKKRKVSRKKTILVGEVFDTWDTGVLDCL